MVKVFYFSGNSLSGRLRAILFDGIHVVRLAQAVKLLLI
jgi:hypothetical protein